MKRWQKQYTTQKGPRPQMACLFSSQCTCVCVRTGLCSCVHVYADTCKGKHSIGQGTPGSLYFLHHTPLTPHGSHM